MIVAAERRSASSRGVRTPHSQLFSTQMAVPMRWTCRRCLRPRQSTHHLSAAGTENVVIVISPRRSAIVGDTSGRPMSAAMTRLLSGFARSGDETGRRSRATVSWRALASASSDTSPCSEAIEPEARQSTKDRPLRSGVASTTGWPSWAGEILRCGVLNEKLEICPHSRRS